MGYLIRSTGGKLSTRSFRAVETDGWLVNAEQVVGFA